MHLTLRPAGLKFDSAPFNLLLSAHVRAGRPDLAVDALRRLEPTRTDLSRRAQAADAADELLVAASAGDARPAALVTALTARKAVEELAERRRRTVADAVARMVQLLGDHPKEAATLAALKAELDSAGRAAAWRVRGLDARIAEATMPGGDDAPPAPEPAP